MSDPQPNPQQHNQNLNALAAALLAAYAAAQVDLIAKFAALISRYAIGDLLLIQLRKVAREAALGMRVETPALVYEIVDKAVADGVKAAGPGAPTNTSFGVSGDTFESHAERSARAIREDLQGKLNQLSYRITRYADDIYQSVITDAAQSQVLGLLTPHQAQHSAYEALVRRGVDGITDSRGRKWELQAYVDMAVRTAAQRAFNVSHLDRMQALGIDLFMVDADGHPCPLCLPWEGAILSVEPDSRARATIAEATAAGLFHPRCRHVLSGYFPGVTDIPEPHTWNADDAARYAESQTQRRLEREIRAAKRQLAGAYTPEMTAAANLAVRRAQANLRDFIARTDRVRITAREQVQ